MFKYEHEHKKRIYLFIRKFKLYIKSCCLKCRKNTESKNLKSCKNRKRKNNAFIKLCGNKKLRFIKEQEASGLLSRF